MAQEIVIPSPSGTPVYRPAVKVTLHKLVKRREGDAQRHTAAAREIDLTPFLGDGGTVRTMKNIREPAGGFVLAFPDQPQKDTLDSLSALIEPMDMIEIRATRNPQRFLARLPLIMRGFVSVVDRIEKMGADGTPARVVVVHGQDAGKLWMIHHVISQIANMERPLLTAFQLQAAVGLQATNMPIGEFMKQLVEMGINEKIKDLSTFADRQLAPFTTTRISVPEGNIIPQQVGAIRPGPFWSIVEEFADRPWNEVFVEDEEEGPAFVFRPTPFKALDGSFIMQGAADPGAISMDDKAVVSLRTRRTDARIANVFWVPPGASILASNRQIQPASFAAGAPLDFEHPNNRRELYGARMMEAQTRLVPTEQNQPVSHMPAGQQRSAVGPFVAWHEKRSAYLKAMNRDNGVLEDGEATVRGHEELKPGRYWGLDRGSLRWQAYITAVAHDIAPFGGWTTSLTLERGTGFYVRCRTEGSPYFAEGARGPFNP